MFEDDSMLSFFEKNQNALEEVEGLIAVKRFALACEANYD